MVKLSVTKSDDGFWLWLEGGDQRGGINIAPPNKYGACYDLLERAALEAEEGDEPEEELTAELMGDVLGGMLNALKAPRAKSREG